VPILAVEDVGPIEAIKRSVGYLKKTWGEQLVGTFSIGLVFSLLILAFFGIAGIVVALMANARAQPWAYIAVAAVLILFILGVSLVNSTLTGIYTAAVYQYASTGDAGNFFEENEIKNAFHQKSSRNLM